MEPFISIILPTFNSSDTICRCVESINNQKFNDYELIVIDGLSSDKTIEMIHSIFSNSQQLTIKSEKDDGIYDAMNKGIKVARGKWLYFLGSDDFFVDDEVLCRFKSFSEKSNSKIIYGNVKINGEGYLWGENGYLYGGKFDRKRMLHQNVCHQAIFYHRELFTKLGLYNTKYKYCADWDFNLKCFFKYKPLYIDLPIACYSVSGASSTSADQPFLEDFFDNLKSYSNNFLFLNIFFDFRQDIKRLSLSTIRSGNLILGFYFLFCYSIHTGNIITDFVKPFTGWIFTKIKSGK